MNNPKVIPLERPVKLELQQQEPVPLVVDMDGTLICTDILWEATIQLLKKNPLYLFQLLRWLLKGKAYFKERIFERVQINSAIIPLNTDLLKFLNHQSHLGRKLILATASPRSVAVEICKRCPIFDEIYGTDSRTNLSGKQKLAMLIQHFGRANFDYIGNSSDDLVIFRSARYTYLVNPGRSLQSKTRKGSNLIKVWQTKKTNLASAVRSLRIYQWVKNLLVFVPLLTSHNFSSWPLILQSFIAFIAFSMVASAGYLVNDLFDIDGDRVHPRKRDRPIASGDFSIPHAILLAVAFFVAGFLLSFFSPTYFWIVLLTYFATSLFYSFYLKKLVLYDVFILAVLYSVRVVAGGIVSGVPLSFWLIAFSTFIFLSLAFVKRYSELVKLTNEPGLRSRGREYMLSDLHLLEIMGIVSGFMAVVVFSLYIDSREVVELYSNPKLLWVISLLFLFWISRIWLCTIRGKMTDDPIIFAMKDKTSYFICLLVALTIFIAT